MYWWSWTGRCFRYRFGILLRSNSALAFSATQMNKRYISIPNVVPINNNRLYTKGVKCLIFSKVQLSRGEKALNPEVYILFVAQPDHFNLEFSNDMIAKMTFLTINYGRISRLYFSHPFSFPHIKIWINLPRQKKNHFTTSNEGIK